MICVFTVCEKVCLKLGDDKECEYGGQAKNVNAEGKKKSLNVNIEQKV